MLTRMGEAKDWGTGLALKANMLGRMARLEVHHIFPKSRLYSRDYGRAEVNAVANFCFLTKETNLVIGDRLPEEYFETVEKNHPGALASQWIPMDPALWRIDRYRDFLEARKALLAAETNRRFAALLHGESRWISASAPVDRGTRPGSARWHCQRGRGSGAGSAQRLAGNTGASARASGLRPCRRSNRRAEGGVRSGVAGGAAARPDPARRRPVERNGGGSRRSPAPRDTGASPRDRTSAPMWKPGSLDSRPHDQGARRRDRGAVSGTTAVAERA